MNYSLLCVKTAERDGKVIQKLLKKKSPLGLKSLPTQHLQQSRESRAASFACRTSSLEKKRTDLNSGVSFERWALANEYCSTNGIPL